MALKYSGMMFLCWLMITPICFGQDATPPSGQEQLQKPNVDVDAKVANTNGAKTTREQLTAPAILGLILGGGFLICLVFFLSSLQSNPVGVIFRSSGLTGSHSSWEVSRSLVQLVLLLLMLAAAIMLVSGVPDAGSASGSKATNTQQTTSVPGK